MATINQQVLDFLFEYLQSNLKTTPDIAEVKSFLVNKLTERDIVTSYKKGIVTSAEVTAFIQSHIYTIYSRQSRAHLHNR